MGWPALILAFYVGFCFGIAVSALFAMASDD